MTLYTAVVTSVGATKIPQYLGGLISPIDLISYFKVGEGGWVDPGSGRQPRTPDPGLTDLDIIMDASRAAPDKRYNVGENAGYFQKALVLGDFSAPTPGILRVSCMLLNAEYNLETDGTLIYDVGGPYGLPEIWEIGLFDQNDDMILYGTFSKETKDASKTIENVCRLAAG
jgi:hypothetical protein